jgi:hypothetical protein
VRAPASARLELKTYSYDDRRVVLPMLSEALERSGCWVLERQARSASELLVRFELQLRSAVELYSALVGTGLELTRGSHLALTSLCMLRSYQRRQMEPFRMVEVLMAVSFLEETELAAPFGAEAAAA